MTHIPQNDRGELMSELGKALLKINALRIGTFETSSGQITPYFIDLRKLPSFPSAFSLALDCLQWVFRERKNSFEPDIICGIPVLGLLLSSVLSQRHAIPLVYPSKSHPNSIIGLVRPGTKVLIISDISETGLSIKSAAQAVRSTGGIVNNALTLIDRSEGAGKALSEVGVMLHSFTTTEELVSTLKKNMALTDEQIVALESGTP